MTIGAIDHIKARLLVTSSQDTPSVPISKQALHDVLLYIEELEEEKEFLDALMAHGVDNWQGYEAALHSLRE